MQVKATRKFMLRESEKTDMIVGEETGAATFQMEKCSRS
jgi:hypothetical protein